MTTQWVVVLRCGDRPDDTYVYGPLADKDTASRFADFLTTEVDPAHALAITSPVPELLLFWNRTLTGKPPAALDRRKPKHWPPKPGHIWEDRDGDRWICTTMTGDGSYLTRIGKQADDSAEEIWRLCGPLTFVQHIPPNSEVPF